MTSQTRRRVRFQPVPVPENERAVSGRGAARPPGNETTPVLRTSAASHDWACPFRRKTRLLRHFAPSDFRAPARLGKKAVRFCDKSVPFRRSSAADGPWRGAVLSFDRALGSFCRSVPSPSWGRSAAGPLHPGVFPRPFAPSLHGTVAPPCGRAAGRYGFIASLPGYTFTQQGEHQK